MAFVFDHRTGGHGNHESAARKKNVSMTVCQLAAGTPVRCCGVVLLLLTVLLPSNSHKMATARFDGHDIDLLEIMHRGAEPRQRPVVVPSRVRSRIPNGVATRTAHINGPTTPDAGGDLAATTPAVAVGPYAVYGYGDAVVVVAPWFENDSPAASTSHTNVSGTLFLSSSNWTTSVALTANVSSIAAIDDVTFIAVAGSTLTLCRIHSKTLSTDQRRQPNMAVTAYWTFTAANTTFDFERQSGDQQGVETFSPPSSSQEILLVRLPYIFVGSKNTTATTMGIDDRETHIFRINVGLSPDDPNRARPIVVSVPVRRGRASNYALAAGFLASHGDVVVARTAEEAPGNGTGGNVVVVVIAVATWTVLPAVLPLLASAAATDVTFLVANELVYVVSSGATADKDGGGFFYAFNATGEGAARVLALPTGGRALLSPVIVVTSPTTTATMTPPGPAWMIVLACGAGIYGIDPWATVTVNQTIEWADANVSFFVRVGPPGPATTVRGLLLVDDGLLVCAGEAMVSLVRFSSATPSGDRVGSWFEAPTSGAVCQGILWVEQAKKKNTTAMPTVVDTHGVLLIAFAGNGTFNRSDGGALDGAIFVVNATDGTVMWHYSDRLNGVAGGLPLVWLRRLAARDATTSCWWFSVFAMQLNDPSSAVAFAAPVDVVTDTTTGIPTILWSQTLPASNPPGTSHPSLTPLLLHYVPPPFDVVVVVFDGVTQDVVALFSAVDGSTATPSASRLNITRSGVVPAAGVAVVRGYVCVFNGDVNCLSMTNGTAFIVAVRGADLVELGLVGGAMTVVADAYLFLWTTPPVFIDFTVPRRNDSGNWNATCLATSLFSTDVRLRGGVVPKDATTDRGGSPTSFVYVDVAPNGVSVGLLSNPSGTGWGSAVVWASSSFASQVWFPTTNAVAVRSGLVIVGSLQVVNDTTSRMFMALWRFDTSIMKPHALTHIAPAEDSSGLPIRMRYLCAVTRDISFNVTSGSDVVLAFGRTGFAAISLQNGGAADVVVYYTALPANVELVLDGGGVAGEPPLAVDASHGVIALYLLSSADVGGQRRRRRSDVPISGGDEESELSPSSPPLPEAQLFPASNDASMWSSVVSVALYNLYNGTVLAMNVSGSMAGCDQGGDGMITPPRLVDGYVAFGCQRHAVVASIPVCDTCAPEVRLTTAGGIDAPVAVFGGERRSFATQSGVIWNLATPPTFAQRASNWSAVGSFPQLTTSDGRPLNVPYIVIAGAVLLVLCVFSGIMALAARGRRASTSNALATASTDLTDYAAVPEESPIASSTG